MAIIAVNESHAPIITAVFTGPPSDDDVKRYLARSTNYLAMQLPYALIISGTKIDTLSATQRRLFADWVRDHKAALERLCAGQAYIMPSVLQRMILRSVLMLQTVPVPNKVFSTTVEAWPWLVERLDTCGILIDATLREPREI